MFELEVAVGTAYAVEHMAKMLTWDVPGRAGNADPRGYRLDVTEFDYRGVNQVLHECFIAVPDLLKKMGFTLEWALLVGTQVHATPGAAHDT